MPNRPLPDKVPLAAARFCLLAAALTPLVRTEFFIFPSVFPKALFFRTLITAALAFTAIGLVRVRARPRLDPVGIALVAFCSALALAAVLGIAPERSLFGSVQRSAGVIEWVYLTAFYLLARALFRRADWRRYLHAAAAVAVLVSLVAIYQHFGANGRRVGSTLGNAGYLGALLLLSFVVLGLLISRERISKTAAALAAALFTIAFIFAGTLSALIGIAAGALVLLPHAARIRPRAKHVWFAAATAALLVLAVVLVRANPETVARIPLLKRVANPGLPEIAATVGARRTLWKIAAAAFVERPVLGWGTENFLALTYRFRPANYCSIVGDHYYADRAHNFYLELLASAGVVGLLAFAAIFACVAWQLVKHRRRFRRLEHICLSGGVLAYLVYLAAWFEDLSTAALLVALLALIGFRARGRFLRFGGRPAALQRLLAVGTALAAVLLWYSHALVPARGAAYTAAGVQAEFAEERLDTYARALARPVPELTDAIAPISQYIAALALHPERLQQPRRRDLVAQVTRGTLGALDAQVAREPHNPLPLAQRAGVLAAAATIFGAAPMFEAAMADANRAAALSPQTPDLLVDKADILLGGAFSDVEAAAAAVAAARALDPGCAVVARYADRIRIRQSRQGR